MKFEFEFKSEDEKTSIIDTNKSLYLTDIKYLYNGNYLVFTDIMPRPNLESKISYLEAENEALREELIQIQTSIASLTSLIATTLEEK